jgi:ribose transport system ATP-binding protein
VAAPLLEVRDLSKTFPGVVALDRVSLSVAPGETLAVVGQNGSGKSTLVKILAGVHHADPGGEVRADGELHFIHQDLGLVPLLSTIENLDIGRRIAAGRGLLPAPVRQERRRAEELIARFGARFDVRAPVASLTPAERTIVAIARALDGWEHPHNVLVLDEPTASLHGDEVAKLFAAVRRVAENGAGVIFISHRLDEVIDLADRVIALRDGRTVADARRGEFDHDALVRMIAGRDIEAAGDRETSAGEDVVLTARAIAGERVAPLDLELRAGEVVGVAGILGSGREHLASMLFGAAPRSGAVHVGPTAVPPANPAAAIAAGMGFVPADRRRHGAVMTMNARENLTLPLLAPLRGAAGGLSARAEREEAARWVATVGIVPPDPERQLALFSGGNQQKAVIAKWLRTVPRVLLLDEPTQGVDVGAKAAVYGLVARAARDGAAVLLSSSDTKELAQLCDRVLVLRDGAIVAEIAGPALTEARLVRECLGVSGEVAS